MSTYQELRVKSRAAAAACPVDEVVLIAGGGQGCPAHVVRRVRLPKAQLAELSRPWGTRRRLNADRKLHEWARRQGGRATFGWHLEHGNAETVIWDV